MREFAKQFYHSRAWKDCRASYITKVHGLCERCAAGGKIVHHKVYLSEQNIHDPNITLWHDNLELRCQDCHNAEHMARLPIQNGLYFDEQGNLINKKIV